MEYAKIKETSAWLSERMTNADVAIVLGSGLGDLANEAENAEIIPYSQIPNFPVSTAIGHAGRLVSGQLGGRQVIMLQGRSHWYEGYGIQEVVRPVRILADMGVQNFIITNAAGCLNRNYQVGQFMFIVDHINLSGINPLIGANIDEFGPRFPDMSTAYDKDLISLGERIACDMNILTRRGVYVWCQGPSYETPAEIRAFTLLGADAVGMSTVPEVIALRHMNRRVLGISCLTNMAAGILPQALSAEEVIETANRVKPQFKALIKGIVEEI